MNHKYKIGRNDPCPCGSGKKYKKCCELTKQDYLLVSNKGNAIWFNQKIAYTGKVGRKRKEFCLRYLRHKRNVLEAMQEEQKRQVATLGKTISCHRGCSFCCYEFIGASLGECEAIVYFLYQNEEILTQFVKAFPIWVEKIQPHKDILGRFASAYKYTLDNNLSDESQRLFEKEAESYNNLQIPCPFLVDGACSIYEIRPWVCASIFSTAPSDWCDPKDVHDSSLCRTDFPISIELPFYDEKGSITVPDASIMPDTVYRILAGGFKFISEIQGLESLWLEVLRDIEVRHFVS